jgi:hypothetical protein
MPHWEYKALIYHAEPGFASFRVGWMEVSGREYGRPERARGCGSAGQAMRLLEPVLRELDQGSWEVVSTNMWTVGLFGRLVQGLVLLRRPAVQAADAEPRAASGA